MERTLLYDGEIRLRAPEPSDLDFLFGLENDESLWTASCNSAPYSRLQLQNYIKECVHDLFAEHQIRFVVEYRGVAAGCIDLTEIDAVSSHAQVGIAVLAEYRNRGVAAAALSMLCDYARLRLRLHQLAAMVQTDNEYSLKLFVSNGFVKCGEMKEWLWNGERYDDVILLQKIF